MGYGRNLDKGITEEQAESWLAEDIQNAIDELFTHYPEFRELKKARQDVLINMVFNLGLTGFSTFKKMIRAIRHGMMDEAAQEMLNSKWASQVGHRATELALQMQTGRYKPEL